MFYVVKLFEPISFQTRIIEPFSAIEKTLDAGNYRGFPFVPADDQPEEQAGFDI
jgi:hypothetical protein